MAAKLGAILALIVIAFLITPAFFYMSWNVFAVEVLHLQAVTFYQSIFAVVLLGTIFSLAKIGKVGHE